MYRRGQALKVPGGWGSQISRQSVHEDGKVIIPTHRPPLPSPGKYSWYSFLNQPRTILRPEWLCQRLSGFSAVSQPIVPPSTPRTNKAFVKYRKMWTHKKVYASGSPYKIKRSFYRTDLSDTCFVQFQIFITKEYLELEPIGMLFIIFFGAILVIQFIAMLIHRFGTLSHMLATTDITWFRGGVQVSLTAALSNDAYLRFDF